MPFGMVFKKIEFNNIRNICCKNSFLSNNTYMNLLDRNCSWYLEGIMPDGKSWFIPLDKFPFTVGRNTDCSLCLNSVNISRNHARFMLKNNEVYIIDLGSTNGTIVNNKRIDKKTILENNYKISFGEFDFKIHSTEPENDAFFKKTIIENSSVCNNRFVKNFNLTKKESEILQLILKGISTREIADRLSISSGTAKNHILNIYKKTDTHSKFELFALYKQIEESG